MTVKKQNQIIYLISLLYTALPVMIFFLGWMKIWIGAPVCILVLLSLFFIMRRDENDVFAFFTRKNLAIIILIAAIILLWVYLSGIGAFVYQSYDHNCRNAVFEYLVKDPWPVIHTMPVGDTAASEPRMLIYYIGFWLPSALAGKIFGLTAGYIFQILWAALGVFLVFYYISEYLKTVSWKPMLLFIFFSGLDIVGHFFAQKEMFQLMSHIEGWANGFQYSSFTTQLYWVFNQAIYAWIIFLLVMRQKNNKSSVFLLSCGLISCTIPFIGMLPFAIVNWIKNCRQQITDKTSEGSAQKTKANKKTGKAEKSIGVKKHNPILTFILSLLSIENIIAGGAIGILSFFYLRANASAMVSGTETASYGKSFLFRYILFIILEVGIYLLLIFRQQKRNVLYYVTTASLLLIPLVSMGRSNDFCMRASIPGLMMLYLLVMQTLIELRKQRRQNRKWIIAICIVLAIGAINPFHEINRAISVTTKMANEGWPIKSEPAPEEEIFSPEGNFSGSYTNNETLQAIMRDTPKQ